MISIAQPYALFDGTIPVLRLELAATNLLAEVEPQIVKFYKRFGHAWPINVEVNIELGSTRAKITVATLATLFISYGSIRQSIDYLIKDAQNVGDLVLPQISHGLDLHEQPRFKQRRLGVPGQLKRLFLAVERRELTAQEAMEQVKRLLEAADVSPKDSQQLLDRIAPEIDVSEDPRRPLDPVRGYAQVPPERVKRLLEAADGWSEDSQQVNGSDGAGTDMPNRLPTPGPHRVPVQIEAEALAPAGRRKGVRVYRNKKTSAIEIEGY